LTDASKTRFVIKVPTMLLSLGRPILYRAMWGFKKPEVIPPRISLERLRTQIDDDQIPQEYGGSSPYKLGEHPYQLRANAVRDKYLPISQADVTAAGGTVDHKSLEEKSLREEAPYASAHNLDNHVSEEGGNQKKSTASLASLLLDLCASLLAFAGGLWSLLLGGSSLSSPDCDRSSSDVSSNAVTSLQSTDNGSTDDSERPDVIDVPN